MGSFLRDLEGFLFKGSIWFLFKGSRRVPSSGIYMGSFKGYIWVPSLGI